MESLPVISSPWSEPWVAWTMLGLLVLATLAHAMQPQAIATGFRSIFSTGDRNSMFIDADLDRRAELINIFLAICIFSMGAYVSLLAYVGTGEYSFRTYGMIILITVVLLLVRAIFGMLAAFTFVPRSTTHTFFYHYYHLTVCTAIVHYPIVLLCLFWSALTPGVIILLNATVLAFYLIAIFVKSCLLMMRSMRQIVYILMYLITLELLPFLGVFALSYQLITK